MVLVNALTLPKSAFSKDLDIPWDDKEAINNDRYDKPSRENDFHQTTHNYNKNAESTHYARDAIDAFKQANRLVPLTLDPFDLRIGDRLGMSSPLPDEYPLSYEKNDRNATLNGNQNLDVRESLIPHFDLLRQLAQIKKYGLQSLSFLEKEIAIRNQYTSFGNAYNVFGIALDLNNVLTTAESQYRDNRSAHSSSEAMERSILSALGEIKTLSLGKLIKANILVHQQMQSGTGLRPHQPGYL